MTAWRQDIVPHAISSNPVMARAYSQIVYGYLRDCQAAWRASPQAFPLDPEQPFYIIELGAGSGRLASHFLHQFLPRFERSDLSGFPIKYVMTDFVPEILADWQAHEKLKQWVAAGVLDFALFDIEEPRPLQLLQTGQTLPPGRLHNPLIVIANYFFDSIPQDCFLIQDGQLYENLLSVFSTQAEPDLSDPALWERIELSYESLPVQQPYYEDKDFNQILEYYESELADTALLFPKSALTSIKYWQAFAQDRLLLLSSDKGYSLETSLLHQEEPLPDLHGSFSFMVNYHAISHYIEKRGGTALYPPHYQDNLQVLAYLPGRLPQAAQATKQAFRDVMQSGGPDDFFTLKKAVEPHYASLSLSQILSFLRISSWDADVFLDCLPAILAQVQPTSSAWYPDIHEAVKQIWAQHLPLANEKDVAGAIGQILIDIGYFPQALFYLQESEKWMGPQAENHYRQALCHFARQDYDAARSKLRLIFEIDPAHAGARQMHIALKTVP